MIETPNRSNPHAPAILKEQVDLLYRQSTPGFLATTINSTILVVALHRVHPTWELLSWYTLTLGVTLGRFLLTRHFRSTAIAEAEAALWARRFVIGTGAVGICWGLAGTALFPRDSTIHQIFVLIIIAGMSAGGITFFSPVKRAYVAFIVPMLVPLAILLLLQDSAVHAFIALLTLIFLATLLITSNRLNAIICESLRLRHEKEDLVDSLAHSKEALKQTNIQLSQNLVELGSKERELRDSYGFLEKIMDHTTNAIFVLDLNGRFTHLNHVTSSISGYERDEILGQPFTHLLEPDQIDTARDYFRRCIDAGETVCNKEIDFIRKDGRQRTIRFNVAPLQEGGTITAMVGTAEDITERKKIERMKDEFVATVSHELRTPLTSIRGSLGLVHGGATNLSGQDTDNLIRIAYNNTDRLIHLINDLLDIQKLEAGEMQFICLEQALEDVVDEAVTGNQGYASHYQVDLVVAERTPGIIVNVDRQRMMQALSNLISNAVKFSPPGAAVELRITRRDGRVRIAITDHGPGIPDEFRARIFHKFAQADSSNTRKKGGTGLGLSVTKGIVERMDGAVDYTSVPGQGTTFYIELPIVD